MAQKTRLEPQNFGLASKRQPIHKYQDQKLAPEAHAGSHTALATEQGRPRCPSPAPDAHATAPPPRVPLERRSSPSAPRATWPHARAANRPAARPTPPSRRHPQAPGTSSPSRRPRSTSVWRAPLTARAKHKAPKTKPNERLETPPGTIRRLLPTVAPEPAREGWLLSVKPPPLSKRAHCCESKA